MNSILILILIFFSSVSFAQTSCNDLTKGMSKSTISLSELIKSEQYEKIQTLLFKDSLDVQKQIDDLPADEYERIKTKVWSGIYTGEVISTPISVLKEASDYLQIRPGEKFVDIGSGHGLPSMVFGALNPNVEVVGYEIIRPKVMASQKSANKYGLENVSFILQDLSDPKFKLPPANYFYFFNPVMPKIVADLAEQIRILSKDSPVKVLVYHDMETGLQWTDRLFRDAGFKLYKNDIKAQPKNILIFKYPNN